MVTGSGLGFEELQRLCGPYFMLPLIVGQVEALMALGPDYQSTFSPSETDSTLESAPAAAAALVYGREPLGPRLLLSYNAQVLPFSFQMPFHRA